MSLRIVYLIMAILGAVIPLVLFAGFAIEQGFTVQGLLAAGFANGAAAGFTTDLFISSFVFWIYMWSKKAQGPVMWPFVAINLLIGLSCALPAYLWASTKSS